MTPPALFELLLQQLELVFFGTNAGKELVKDLRDEAGPEIGVAPSIEVNRDDLPAPLVTTQYRSGGGLLSKGLHVPIHQLHEVALTGSLVA